MCIRLHEHTLHVTVNVGSASLTVSVFCSRGRAIQMNTVNIHNELHQLLNGMSKKPHSKVGCQASAEGTITVPSAGCLTNVGQSCNYMPHCYFSRVPWRHFFLWLCRLVCLWANTTPEVYWEVPWPCCWYFCLYSVNIHNESHQLLNASSPYVLPRNGFL